MVHALQLPSPLTAPLAAGDPAVRSAEVPSALADLRASAALAAARAGVPTLLALQWEESPTSGPADVAVPQRVVDDGHRLAGSVAASWEALAADQRDDDLACVASVLHATALGVVRDDLDDAPHLPAPRRPTCTAPRGPVAATAPLTPPAVGLASHLGALARGHHLRVVNYHNTPPSRRDQLREELAALTRRYRPWTLTDLDAAMTTGTWPDDDRPGLLPVFYEGYRASATVAAPVCEEIGITGWFAVCTGFVDCPPAQQELYARSHRIGLLPEDLAGDRAAMTWDDVGALAQRHVVFAHTASHAGIEETPTDDDLQREVHAPAAAVRAATGTPSAAFAWLHGSPTRMSARHDAAVREAGYRYLVSNTMLHRL